MFHHTAVGLMDYVYVVRMVYHKDCDPEDPQYCGKFLLIRDLRAGHVVSERIVAYRNIPDSECEQKIQEDALCVFNRAVLCDQVAFVCDSMMEQLIRRVNVSERVQNAIRLDQSPAPSTA